MQMTVRSAIIYVERQLSDMQLYYKSLSISVAQASPSKLVLFQY